MSRYADLRQFLLAESRKCCRPAVGRFSHPWIAPMPLSASGAAFLRAHGFAAAGEGAPAEPPGARGGEARGHASGGPLDVFNTGDYSLGLFHHDASEASIELLEHAEFVEPCCGSLLNLLDNMRPDGFVHRVELVTKSHEAEPSKPVLAQFALRCAAALERHAGRGAGVQWLLRNEVYERVGLFLRYLETHYAGMHGLILAHSALQTGFDNDMLTVALPDRTVEDPGINAFMVLEHESMAVLAHMLSRDADIRRARSRAERLRYLMNELTWWDEGPDTGYYVALRWKHGVAQLAAEIVSDHAGNAIEPMLSWVSLLPLYAGAAHGDRARKVCNLLLDPARFWGPAGVRTLPRDSKYFNESPRMLVYDHKVSTRSAVSNWCGPVWILSNYYMAEGLLRAGRPDAARDLALRTADVCLRGLHETGSLHENYNDAGRGLWPAEGGFVSWNVLVLTMLRRFAGEPI